MAKYGKSGVKERKGKSDSIQRCSKEKRKVNTAAGHRIGLSERQTAQRGKTKLLRNPISQEPKKRRILILKKKKKKRGVKGNTDSKKGEKKER